MKTASSAIFDLIHSLSKTEKRYFAVQASKHTIGEQNQYQQLFNLIADQTSYNETAIKEKWLAQGGSAHFAVLKRQLYDQVLSALHHYHAARSWQEQLKTMLHQAEILLQKGLYKPCQQQLKKCKVELEKHEALEWWPEYYRIVRNLNSKTYFKGKGRHDLGKEAQDELAALKELQQAKQLEQKADQIAWLHYSKMSGRDEQVKNELKEHINKLGELKTDLLRNQLNQNRALGTAHFVLGDVGIAYRHNSAAVRLLENNDAIDRYPDRYFSMLNNYLIDSLVTGRTEEVITGLKKLRALGDRPVFRKLHQLPANIFRLGYQLELNMHLRQGNFEEAPRLSNEINEGLRKHKVVVHNKMSFQYLLAYLHFGNADFQATIDHLQLIIDEPDQQAVQEIQRFARMLLLIAHYESKNYRLLESLIESTYRYQKSRGKLLQAEQLLLHLLRKINYVDEQHISHALFTAFRDKLGKALEDANETRILNYFNLSAWAESHLTGLSFGEVYRNKR